MRRLLTLAADLMTLSVNYPEIASEFEDLFTNTARKLLAVEMKDLKILNFELGLAIGTNYLCRRDNPAAMMGTPEKLQAIKLYQERTGLGLREAKCTIERAIYLGHTNFDVRTYLREQGMTV